MTSMRAWRAQLLLLGLVAGCSSEPLAQIGETCAAPDDCESGRCEPDVFGNRCTTECSSSEPCPMTSTGARLVCGAGGLCISPCTEGSASGSDASTQICVDGLYVACSERDPIADCDVCGCAPFGGGTCVAGRGCVTPQPNGAACTDDVDCESGSCHRDTELCGPPRAMGEPCTVDTECETRNCSTDGDTTVTGVCNQELGSECTGFGRTPTCTNCLRWDSILPPVCAREHCGPDAACAQLGDSRRVWSCEMSTDGTNRCYERCDPESSYNCFNSSDFCHSNGFCG